MDAYPVDLSEILENFGASIDVYEPFALDSYRVGEDTYSLEEPVTVDVVVTNTGTGVVATGTATAHVKATCSRCLCEFPLEVTADVEGFYVHSGQDHDLPEEQEVELIGADGVIDLAPALHAAIVLETPFAPLHDAECAGICPTCGADLNEGPCGCQPEDAEEGEAPHPFAGLKDLLGDRPADEGDVPAKE